MDLTFWIEITIFIILIGFSGFFSSSRFRSLAVIQRIALTSSGLSLAWIACSAAQAMTFSVAELIMTGLLPASFLI